MESTPASPQLLTSAEAALQLRKTPLAFRDAICRSKAPWAHWLATRRIWLGRRYYLRREDVEAVSLYGDAVADFQASRRMAQGIYPLHASPESSTKDHNDPWTSQPSPKK
ncbi:MAG: hypothetical protein WCY67_10750 [Acidithiobacillus sp.]